MKLQARMGGSKAADRTLRWFFATDIHGSERCFRKFLAAAEAYAAEVLILGGDIAGKAIVPICRTADGRVSIHHGSDSQVLDETAASEAESRLKDAGLYPRWCTADERDRLATDFDYREGIFEELIGDQTRAWCELAAERLRDSVRLIITPGNDDPLIIDEILRQAARVECPERELLELGPMTLASLGNTNRTPWHTPREFSESELAAQIDEMLSPNRPSSKLVFNFHCPPKNSGLDTAAQIDENLRTVTVGGQAVTTAAGSSAVRDAVVRYTPVVGLHGHIHESAGAWRCNGTICLNPGSDYSSGVLKGALVAFAGDGRYKGHMLTTG